MSQKTPSKLKYYFQVFPSYMIITNIKFKTQHDCSFIVI